MKLWWVRWLINVGHRGGAEPPLPAMLVPIEDCGLVTLDGGLLAVSKAAALNGVGKNDGAAVVGLTCMGDDSGNAGSGDLDGANCTRQRTSDHNCKRAALTRRGSALSLRLLRPFVLGLALSSSSSLLLDELSAAHTNREFTESIRDGQSRRGARRTGMRTNRTGSSSLCQSWIGR